MLRSWMRSLLLANLWLVGASLAHAADEAWPLRPVKVIVPFAPGGGTDVLGRVIAERLQTALGQPFVVDNKPGAGGNIGTALAGKSAADGYTLLVTTNTHVMNVAFYNKLPYEPIKDFAPVSLVATSPLLLVVNADSPYRTAGELMAAAKAKPESITYGSTGVGTPQHMAPAMLEAATGAAMVHVPYKGAGLVANALLAKEVTMAVGAVNSLLPHVKAGKLRALAVADARRSQLLPEVPTLAEALSLPGFSVELWYGVLMPAGTPRPIIDRVNAEVRKVMRDPDLQANRFAPLGMEGVRTSPAELLKIMQDDIPKYTKAARAANITPE